MITGSQYYNEKLRQLAVEEYRTYFALTDAFAGKSTLLEAKASSQIDCRDIQ